MMIFYAIIGAVLASTINCLAYRLAFDINLSRRSFCECCQTQLSWWQLIPVFSGPLLRFKCFTCRASFSIQLWLIECLFVVYFVRLMGRFDCLLLFCCVGFVAVEDGYLQKAHTDFFYLIFGFCLFWHFSWGLLGIVLVTGGALSVLWLKRGLGSGDIPVILTLLTFLGGYHFACSLLIASVLAIGYCCFYRRQQIALLPFLWIGFAVVTLYM